jgi:5,5'-dehydrodivanillate O-demethylase
MLRRYWHPIAWATDVTDESPAKFVRIPGEDLVIFRDKSGRAGLIADKCPHRNASLVYGRVEERGISCAYHGWLMDCDGNIIETTPERNDAIMRNVTATAYPVQIYLNLIWAYMGPTPVPPMIHFDSLFRDDVHRKIVVHPQLDCNWFHAMENSVDPAHLQVLHQEFAGRGGRVPESTTRGLTDDVDMYEFYLTHYGVMKKRTYKNGMMDEHPLIFPNILRRGPSTQFRVPIDDEHTIHIHVVCSRTVDGDDMSDAFDPPVEIKEPYKHPVDALHPVAKFTMHHVIPQDHMAWETQGPVADSSMEHLSFSDRGIALPRKLTVEQIARVGQGLDPMPVQRDVDHAIIEIRIDDGIQQQQRSRAPEVADGVRDKQA